MPNPNDKNLEKLESILKIVDEGVTKDEFIKSFEEVLKIVLRIEKRTSESIDKLEKTYQVLLSKLQQDHGSNLSELKGKVNNLFVEGRLKEMGEEHNTRFSEIKSNIDSLIKSKFKEVDTKVSSLRHGKDGVPGARGDVGRIPSSEEVRIALKPFMDSFKKEWDEQIKNSMSRRGLGGASRIYKRLTGQSFTEAPDGSRKRFTIPKVTVLTDTIAVFHNGSRRSQGSAKDYTLDGRVVVFNAEYPAPMTGDELLVDFEHY